MIAEPAPAMLAEARHGTGFFDLMAHGDDLPIPADARVTERWPPRLVELADFIGAYEALLIAEAFGGFELYVPRSLDTASGARIAAVIGWEKAAILCDTYPHERVTFPTARSALLEAKRQPVIFRARLGEISVTEAVRLTGSSRPYVSRLVNHGWDMPARPKREALASSIRAELEAAGVDAGVIERVTGMVSRGLVARVQPA